MFVPTAHSSSHFDACTTHVQPPPPHEHTHTNSLMFNFNPVYKFKPSFRSDFCTIFYLLVGIPSFLFYFSERAYCKHVLFSFPVTCAVVILTLNLTLRLLMSYIYIYMEHLFLMFLDHTQRRSTVGRTPLDE